jgi:hypothetical protein
MLTYNRPADRLFELRLVKLNCSIKSLKKSIFSFLRSLCTAFIVVELFTFPPTMYNGSFSPHLYS